MGKRGLVILLPMRVRASYPGIDDELLRLPELTLPEIPTGEGGGTVPPPPVVVPPTTPPSIGLTVMDAIARLPRAPENRDYRVSHLKESITFHWEGADEIPVMSDEETARWLTGIAVSHIQKDYGGGQHGDGIMYHEVIARSGNSIITRDYTDILWHANDDKANLTSRAILVLCSSSTPITGMQVAGMRKRVADFSQNAGRRLPVYPHSVFTPTQCPGDAIRAIIQTL